MKLLVLKLTIISIFIAVIYNSTFKWLYNHYTAVDSYYSHGFLIPIIIGFLIWKKMRSINSIAFTSNGLGLIIIISALLMQILSVFLEVYILSEISLFFLIFGITYYLFGKLVMKQLLFPLSFLIFMFPIPVFLINTIAFPMRTLVSECVVFTLSKFGLPISRTGFEIILPNTSLLVDTPCSGIRSLITFLMLGCLFAYFLNGQLRKKIFLIFMSIPIAFVSNVLRVIQLALIAFIYGSKTATEGFFHSFSGITVFIFGLIFLMILREKLNEKI